MKKYISGLVWLVLISASWTWVTKAMAEGSACDCPKLSCNTDCEIEETVTFYSEKCSDGVKVRSCAKPTCVKIDPYPEVCKLPVSAQSGPESGSAPAARMPASEKSPVQGKKKVGIVESLDGQAWLVKDASADEKLNVGDLVNEKDKVKTGPKSRLQIRFDDGNEVILAENSELRLSEVVISKDATKRSVLLQLLKGKVRSQVDQKYKGADNQFKVSTKSAVAGVRGTEFVVELNEDLEKDERRTVVSTFSGRVELRGHDRPEAALVSKAEMAEFVEKDVSREEEPGFISRAYLSQVKRLSENELRRLKDETAPNLGKSRSRDVASVDLVTTCKEPAAEFNQCRWECRGNLPGEKTCRTDKPSVDCVRSVCKADGKWHDDTRLPASFGHYCEPSKVVVGPCDY